MKIEDARKWNKKIIDDWVKDKIDYEEAFVMLEREDIVIDAIVV